MLTRSLPWDNCYSRVFNEAFSAVRGTDTVLEHSIFVFCTRGVSNRRPLLNESAKHESMDQQARFSLDGGGKEAKRRAGEQGE